MPLEAVTPQQAASYRPSPQAVLEARKPVDIVLEQHVAQLNKLQALLGLSLVLGNALALFVLVQAHLAGRLANTEWLSAIYLRFVAGLGAALLGIAGAYLIGLFGSYLLQSLSQLYVRMADASSQAARASEASARQAALAARTGAADALAAKHEAALMAQMGAGLMLIVHAVSAGLLFWGLADILNLQLIASA